MFGRLPVQLPGRGRRRIPVCVPAAAPAGRCLLRRCQRLRRPSPPSPAQLSSPLPCCSCCSCCSSCPSCSSCSSYCRPPLDPLLPAAVMHKYVVNPCCIDATVLSAGIPQLSAELKRKYGGTCITLPRLNTIDHQRGGPGLASSWTDLPHEEIGALTPINSLDSPRHFGFI